MQKQQKFKFLGYQRAVGQGMFTSADVAISQEQDAIASNGVFTAVPWKHASTMAVFPANSFRRFDQSLNLVKGHHGTVTDVQFSPFAQNLLASSSEDATVKFWVCPQEGYKENCNESDATLKGHVKKVLGIQWHKNAEGVIASHAADSTVRVWDVENLKSKIIHPDLPNFATAMQWSPKGDQLGVIVKGGELRIFDPRIPESVQKVRVHEGPRACKFGYIEDGKLITGGSNKMAEREYAIWDTRALDKKIVGGPLGTGLGVGHIYVDQQHKLIYCAGRGESQIGMWQYDPSVPGHMHFLSNHAEKWPTKGFSMMPKWTLSTDKHQVTPFVHLDNKGTIQYIPFSLQNRTNLYQPELYPEFPSWKPSSNYAEWADKIDKDAHMMQLNEDNTLPEPYHSEWAKKINAAHGTMTVAPTESKENGDSAETLAKVAALEKQVEQAKQLELEIVKLRAENQNLQVVKPTHDLNLKSKPILGYWNIRGLGAQIRYLFYYIGVEFEDKMYEAGPAPDFDRSMWLNEKQTLGLEFPNLPYLIDEEIRMTETVAVMKYICAKWAPELVNPDPVTYGRVEMMQPFVAKLKEVATIPCYTGKSNQEIMDDCWPLIQQIVDVLGDRQWLTGDKLTWLDFMFFELVLFVDMLSGEVVCQHYPTLREFVQKFQQLPGFCEAWKDDTKCMKWPWNGDMAHIGGRSSQAAE